MYLKDLIEVAKKGAQLRHPDLMGIVRIELNDVFSEVVNKWGSRLLTLTIGLFDNRWQIKTPHPGDCTECKGLGQLPRGPHDGSSSNWSPTVCCPHCKGTGDEPTPSVITVRVKSGGYGAFGCNVGKVFEVRRTISDESLYIVIGRDWKVKKSDCEPIPDYDKTTPVITVRIKGCSSYNWYTEEIGEVYEVTDGGLSGYHLFPQDYHLNKKDCEPIPPIPEGYRLRRKWGKDEEWVDGSTDLLWSKDLEKWVQSGKSCRERQEAFIYITPLKPATPDPSADCLSGWVKAPWEVLMKILDESYQGHQAGCLHCAAINELADHATKDV